MPKTTKTKFPEQIIVSREGEGDEAYMNVWEDGIAGIDEEKDVAIYRLHRVSRVQITKELAE